MSKIEEKVEELVTKPINELGYRVYDVMYVKEGKDNYLRIFIDNDTGISLDDCEKVNNAITDMLDEADYIKDQYFLEISSSGVERHIRKDSQLQEHIGKDIDVKLFKPLNKQKELEGNLKQFDEKTITLIINEEEITIERSNISSKMKKNVKKVENKGIDSTELIMALDELEKERGIKKDYVIESIETALVTAYKRNFDVTSDNVKITLNRETGETHVYEELNVVNEVEDWDTQISVEDAKELW